MKGKARLALATLLIAAGVMTARATTDLASAQEADPEAVMRAQLEALRAGDREAWVNTYAPDAIITDVGAGSTAFIGRAASGLVFDLITAGHLEVNETDVTSSGDTVVALAEWSDDISDAAGVERYLTRVESIVQDGDVTRQNLTYDEDDAQTQTYLEFLAGLGNPFPPSEGTVTMTMAGAQAGTAALTPLIDLTAVNINITSGAAGALQPATLTRGGCPAGIDVISPLASLLNGASVTVLSTPLAELHAADLAVSVAASESSSSAASCGALAAASAAPPPAAATPTLAPIAAPNAGAGPSSAGIRSDLWIVLVTVSALVLMTGGIYARRRP